MATAPFLLLIVAAVPRADAAPAIVQPHEARAPIAAVVARPVVVEDEATQRAQLAVAVAPQLSKRPVREPLIAALPTAPLEVETPPLLAPRVEPAQPRGPPA